MAFWQNQIGTVESLNLVGAGAVNGEAVQDKYEDQHRYNPAWGRLDLRLDTVCASAYR